MITLEKLDRLGLEHVQIENFADEEQILDALEGAAEQGRQGWGVRREQAVMLGLSRSTRVLAVLAEQADTAQRSLKGEQMAHGRTKKRLEQMSRSHTEVLEAMASLQKRHDALLTASDALDQTVVLDK